MRSFSRIQEALAEAGHEVWLPAPQATEQARALSPEQLVVGVPGVHEWFVDDERPHRWTAPLAILGSLAALCVGESVSASVLWIGRRCWPYPHALIARDHDREKLLERSIFIDPAGHADRVWAMDVALRSVGVTTVVADGSGLTMAESRRLQLAATAGDTVALLARPRGERGALSAARTRWCVSPRTSNTREQAWTLELLRCKGLRPTEQSARRWLARRDHASGRIRDWQTCDGGVAAEAGDRSGAPTRARIG
jgi:hypothetical protein